MENALVHPIGDVESLTSHFSLLNENRGLLRALRENGLLLAPDITWAAAGKVLLSTYQRAVKEYRAVYGERPVNAAGVAGSGVA